MNQCSGADVLRIPRKNRKILAYELVTPKADTSLVPDKNRIVHMKENLDNVYQGKAQRSTQKTGVYKVVDVYETGVLCHRIGPSPNLRDKNIKEFFSTSDFTHGFYDVKDITR